jgi:hypothetical protein
MSRTRFATLFLCAACLAAPAVADAPDKYQVTGQVVSVTDQLLVLEKDKERFEIARDAGTKVTGEITVGAKVTVKYRMTATSVEVKAPKTEKAETSKKK